MTQDFQKFFTDHPTTRPSGPVSVVPFIILAGSLDQTDDEENPNGGKAK